MRAFQTGGSGPRARVRRLGPATARRLACLCSSLAVVAMLAPAGESLAATGHPFLSRLSEAPLGTPLSEPGAVAIDQADGQVFVGDTGRGVVDVFDAKGTYQAQFGEGVLEAASISVDEQSGDVYVAEPFEGVLVYKPDGSGGYELLSEWSGEATPEKAFGEILGVAVDNSKGPSEGDVYVVDSARNTVYVYKPREGSEAEREGALLRTLSGPKLEEPNGAAVSSGSGQVLIADSAKGAIYTYSPTGSFEAKLNGTGSPNGSFRGKEGEEGNVAAVAIDQATGDIYVAEAERHVVSQYDATGEWLGWTTSTPAGSLGEPLGVAITPSADLYVGDAAGAAVDIFGPGVVVPDVETGKASKLTRTTATLGGVVNGDGKATKYDFEYGTSESLGTSTPVDSGGSGEEKITVALGELHAGTTYFYRLAAENENGANEGIVREFTTPPAVEALATGPVQSLMPTSVVLTGSLTPGGFDAHYYFQWGKTTAYGNTSPTPPGTDAGSGAGAVAANTELTGLTANTTYHYRIVAENSFGSTVGGDQKFTTPGPPRITIEPVTGLEHEAVILRAKVDPDQIATDYHFEYGETTSYGTEVPLGGASIGSGAEPVAVMATLGGLKIGTVYHYRVVAENTSGTVNEPDQTFETVPAAPIDAEYADDVGSTEATLNARINPLGHDTTYYFQYGTKSCRAEPSACVSIPTPPGSDIGSGEADQAASAHVTGLESGTTYYYRVLAINSLGTTEGVEHTLRTESAESSPALVDNRAWEMVSPIDKHGAVLEGLTKEGGLARAAEDGNSISYVADGAIEDEPPGNRSPEFQQVFAKRTPEGWSSQDIATPNTKAGGLEVGAAPEYQAFSPDLSMALVEPFSPSRFSEPPLAPGATQTTIYLRDDESGSFTPLVTEGNTPPGTEFGRKLRFLTATPDLSHVVLNASVALAPPPATAGLYEWAAGKLQFVSALPGGTPAASAELGFFGRDLTHAVSADGSRIVWTNKEENTGRGHLYMRDAVRGETLQLDAAQGIVEPEKGSAQFQTASSDDSKVFFTDRQRLTSDSTAEPSLLSSKADLYECEVVESAGKLACHLKDLTVDGNEGEHAAVQGLVFGAAEDGEDVYLVAQGVLDTTKNGNSESAQAGRNNLYLLHNDGSQWTTSFIAGLAGEDSPEWAEPIRGDTAFLTARVSPNGRYVAFMSAASLTGYDNTDRNSGKRDQEVYLYDSSSPSLTCVSCNPTGERPSGVLDTEEAGEGLGLLIDRRQVWLGQWLAGNIPGWTAQSISSALYQSSYLSDSGRLFFNSSDDLVPQAKNHKADVYEYEPDGVGSCESSTGGCVSLISSGTDQKESAFLEATPSGNDVFFLTASLLLAQDNDTAFDIYDARVCTGPSPCLTQPPVVPPGCSGANACRPAPPPVQPPQASSGTVTPSGPGNLVSQVPPKQESKGAKTIAKPLSRAQKLANALKACRAHHAHAKKKRKACESRARRLYGPHAKAKKTKKATKSSKSRSTRRGGR